MLDTAVRALHGLPGAALGAILAHCERAWPVEACGLVIDGDVLVSDGCFCTAKSFRLAPEPSLALERASRLGRSCVLWHSHTHPAAPERMSADDVHSAAPHGQP